MIQKCRPDWKGKNPGTTANATASPVSLSFHPGDMDIHIDENLCDQQSLSIILFTSGKFIPDRLFLPMGEITHFSALLK